MRQHHQEKQSIIIYTCILDTQHVAAVSLFCLCNYLLLFSVNRIFSPKQDFAELKHFPVVVSRKESETKHEGCVIGKEQNVRIDLIRQQCGMIQLNNFLAIKANLLEQVYGVFVIVIMNHISNTTVTNYCRMYTSMCLQVVISRRRQAHTYTQLLSSSPQSSLSSFSTFHAVVNVLSHCC